MTFLRFLCRTEFFIFLFYVWLAFPRQVVEYGEIFIINGDDRVDASFFCYFSFHGLATFRKYVKMASEVVEFFRVDICVAGKNSKIGNVGGNLYWKSSNVLSAC